MGVVHIAQLKPSKVELLAEWLPQQPWYTEDGPPVRESAFRFDDPAGEVGIETLIISSGAFRFHVPMTYRGMPIDGATLIGELEHSALGHRWVYDGPTDPVYVATTTSAIVNAERDVDMVLDDGTPVPRAEWWANASGSGLRGRTEVGVLHVARALPAQVPAGAPTLDAIWSFVDSPFAVAWLD